VSVGYSGTPLARKLGIRAGSTLATIGAAPGLEELLAPLPADVDWHRDPAIPAAVEAGAGSWDVVLAFMPHRAALEAALPGLVGLIRWDGGLWLAWPKKSSSLASDLDREAVRERLLDTGLVDNKVCAVDDDWSGLRFVHRVEDRPG
jgi:hypothetical protein